VRCRAAVLEALASERPRTDFARLRIAGARLAECDFGLAARWHAAVAKARGDGALTSAARGCAASGGESRKRACLEDRLARLEVARAAGATNPAVPASAAGRAR
jgi:hypothetical protein